MIRIKFITLVLFLTVTFGLNVSESFGQTAPKYSNEFLSIGVGARAFAMGHAVVATTTDETGTYWNPAGLTQLSYPVNLNLMHSEYFAGLSQYDYGAIVFKTSKEAAFGLSMVRFGVDNIPNTLELIDENGNLRFDRVKAFSVADYAFMLSYARALKLKGLSVGGNLKIVRRIGGDFASAWGFGFDASAKYVYKNWRFGATFRDITTTFNTWTFNTSELAEVFELTGNAIPEQSTEITLPKFILGGAYQSNLSHEFKILVEVDADITTDGQRNVLISSKALNVDPHAGAEVSFKEMVFLRMGMNLLQREYDFKGEAYFTCVPSMGAGFTYKRFGVDYALTDLGNVSAAGYSHVFSLRYAIEPKKN